METSKMSSSSSRNRFVDYFVICGLDLNSGLEPDLVAGRPVSVTKIQSYKSVYVMDCIGLGLYISYKLIKMYFELGILDIFI